MNHLRHVLLATALILPLPAAAQSVFSSGSTGSDGPFVVATPPPAIYGHSLAYDSARKVIVMFGGYGGGARNDTWEWDGTKWTLRQLLQGLPAPRYSHAMAYDSARGVIVMFGGYGGFDSSNYLSDTWEFDGTRWTQKTPTTAPSPRYQHAMAFDAARGRVVLHGGSGPANVGAETWLWDGSTWTRTADGPSSAGHALAYDASRNIVVMHSQSNETWEWNGTVWTRRATSAAGPGAGQEFCLAYDATQGRTLLFGGTSNRSDTWLWDGSFWEKRSPTGAPTGRRQPGCAFDGTRATLVMFGGQTNNETWLWNGTAWSTPRTVGPRVTLDMNEKAEGVWNFTAIDVQPGTAVDFANRSSNVPVVWLATGPVTIGGEISLDGDDGGIEVNPGTEASGGPGGFRGGRGGVRFDVSGTYAATPGEGPGGGLPGTTRGQAGGGGGYATQGHQFGTSGAGGGSTYGNRLVQPLVGGSGGGGSASNDTANGRNGGGGGGAILVASSETIHVDGSIHANGGQGSSSLSGDGAGGAIRLVANRISGGGQLQATSGSGGTDGQGRIRTEAFFVQLTRLPVPPNASAPPLSLGVTSTAGRVRITEIAGKPVPNPPLGDTNAPDVVFSEAGSVTVKLATVDIPQGTKLTVRVVAAGQVLTAQSGGVDAAGNATATLNVPAGVGTVQAFAEYIPPAT